MGIHYGVSAGTLLGEGIYIKYLDIASFGGGGGGGYFKNS